MTAAVYTNKNGKGIDAVVGALSYSDDGVIITSDKFTAHEGFHDEFKEVVNVKKIILTWLIQPAFLPTENLPGNGNTDVIFFGSGRTQNGIFPFMADLTAHNAQKTWTTNWKEQSLHMLWKISRHY